VKKFGAQAAKPTVGKKYHPIAEEHKGMPVAPRPQARSSRRWAVSLWGYLQSYASAHTPAESDEEVLGPLLSCGDEAVRKAFWQAYAAFLSAFREETDRWREGDRKARFPVGSFPPGLPFVTEEAYSPP
jgi:hypothetical protein